MSRTVYRPELGETIPAGTQIQARIGYSGKWRIQTKLELSGQGIKVYDVQQDGTRTYYVTERAFSKLCQQYKVSSESLLD